MQETKYDELAQRAIPPGLRDEFKRLEAMSRVHSVIEEMKTEGKALVLTDEENQLLHSFRRFKLRMRDDNEVFTWRTKKPEGIQLVEDTAEILHPMEV
jgi:hypothetical protein